MKTPEAIEQMPVEQLVPYARNARTHSDEQVAQIAGSIREFGFTNPVLIDGQGGIIAGHGRVMAARALGLAAVPCIRLDYLTDAQRRAYVLADNQLALNAGWDEALLAVELRDLADNDYDLGVIGFGADELAALLDREQEVENTADAAADSVPEPAAVTVSATGDVWQLGPHRVMCGDSTDPDHVARLCGTQRAALLHADPPYGMGKQADGVANDNLYDAKLDAFQLRWWRAFRPHLADNAAAYIWGNAPDLWRLWWRGGLSESERLEIRNEIVWRKAGGRQGARSDTNRSYPPAGERCLFFMLGAQSMSNNQADYWEGWEPIRAYLAAEIERVQWTPADVRRITGVGMFSHWFTRSQWTFITEQHYSALQAAASGAAFRREYEEIRREYLAGRAYFDNTHDAMTDVWDFAVVTGDERHGHATPKPVAMMERVMRSSLPAHGLCLEPFGGSGSTLMGAQVADRVCFTMELQAAYVDVIVRRWQDYTGQAATLDGDGRTFAQIAEARAE